MYFKTGATPQDTQLQWGETKAEEKRKQSVMTRLLRYGNSNNKAELLEDNNGNGAAELERKEVRSRTTDDGGELYKDGAWASVGCEGNEGLGLGLGRSPKSASLIDSASHSRDSEALVS